MRKTLVSIVLASTLGACQRTCPPVLEETYEGEGFIVGQLPAKTAVVFYPACEINKEHYLTSINEQNLGKGITVTLYNLEYVGSIINSDRRFKLSKYRVDEYPYQGVYILPARIKYRDLQKDNPVINYAVDYKTDVCTINTPYSRASVELDTLIFLPYSP